MINFEVVWTSMRKSRLFCISILALINSAGFIYCAWYLLKNGYLPSPFLYDKSDTFMDLFNVLHWTYAGGRYTDWGSVYPPLNFIILKIFNFAFYDGVLVDPELMRKNSLPLIWMMGLFYLAIPAFLLKTSIWKNFSQVELMLFYFALIFSAPMLFALERGNLILLCPIVLALVLSKAGMVRNICIAVLINIKPYFVFLLIYYVVRRSWRGLVVCFIFSGTVFLISGLMLGDHFLVFFENIINFTQKKSLFSLREIMAMPSSISAFSYILNNPDGAVFVSRFLNSFQIAVVTNLIGIGKWAVISMSMVALLARSVKMRDVEIFTLLVVVISNLGIWVGGYTYVLYAALIPVFISMRAGNLYGGLLFLIAMPLDVIPLVNEYLGMKFSYLTDSYVGVQWSLGIGSIVRPVVNLLLLFLISYELLMRVDDNAKGGVVRRSKPWTEINGI